MDVAPTTGRSTSVEDEVVYTLRDEEWGVRRFMVRDPAGRVVNVLSHIPRRDGFLFSRYT